MKQILIVLLISSFGAICNCQQNQNFDRFLYGFNILEYPIETNEVFMNLELEMKTKHISESDYNKFLRNYSDHEWVFDDLHSYKYGGKFDVNSNIIAVLYRQDYMPDDVNKQIGEVVLSTFNHKGQRIADIPIAGGYGDSVTFSSIIDNSNRIEVKYIKYTQDSIIKESKIVKIQDNGKVLELD